MVQFQILNFCFPARLLILFVSIGRNRRPTREGCALGSISFEGPPGILRKQALAQLRPPSEGVAGTQVNFVHTQPAEAWQEVSVWGLRRKQMALRLVGSLGVGDS